MRLEGYEIWFNLFFTRYSADSPTSYGMEKQDGIDPRPTLSGRKAITQMSLLVTGLIKGFFIPGPLAQQSFFANFFYESPKLEL